MATMSNLNTSCIELELGLGFDNFGHFLGKIMWPKNPISSYFGQNSEMQNCQDYTNPTVSQNDRFDLRINEFFTVLKAMHCSQKYLRIFNLFFFICFANFSG